MEEATRVFGEILGFVATRPDNDVGTGPDVLWIDESSATCIAFELKTDKDDPATYWKKEIGQGHDHFALDEVRETVALARQYAELGYDAGAYFERLAEISCRDDFTEMQSLKHFQAIVDEYYATREPYRWLHLVSAAKSAAVIHVGKEHQVYNQAKAVLAA